MGVDSKHPAYLARVGQWQQMTDCYEGEPAIKCKGQTYLPPTSGQRIDGLGAGEKGADAFSDYLLRAVFPDYVKQGIEAMVGIMHQEEAIIKVPKKMEPLLKKLGSSGESAQMVLRRLNEYQLKHGRAGILAEVPDGEGPLALPYVVLYQAPRIINWDDGPLSQGKQSLEFVVIDESDDKRTGGFEWTTQDKWRILATAKTAATLGSFDQSVDTSGGGYRTISVESTSANLSIDQWKTPSIAGITLDRIPFVFVNTKDMNAAPDDAPLYGLSNLCLAIYRGEADLRQALHNQGQDTFVVIGAEIDPTKPETRLGAGARVDIPRDGDAKFVGVSSSGLDAQSKTISEDKAAAGELTSRLFDSAGTSYQSGEALRIRVSAKTATLRTIAMTSAEALREILQAIAVWVGENPDEISVEANTDFADTTAASRTLLELTQAKQLGAPLSEESIHRYQMQQGLTQMTYEEEQAAMDKEVPRVPPATELQGQASGGLGEGLGGSRVPRGVEDDTGTEE